MKMSEALELLLMQLLELVQVVDLEQLMLMRMIATTFRKAVGSVRLTSAIAVCHRQKRMFEIAVKSPNVVVATGLSSAPHCLLCKTFNSF